MYYNIIDCRIPQIHNCQQHLKVSSVTQISVEQF
jgi:hypothetical protein